MREDLSGQYQSRLRGVHGRSNMAPNMLGEINGMMEIHAARPQQVAGNYHQLQQRFDICKTNACPPWSILLNASPNGSGSILQIVFVECVVTCWDAAWRAG